MKMTSTQAHRNRAKATLSVIKAKLKPQTMRQSLADRQAERLRRLLVEYPKLSASFDVWMESRLSQIKDLKKGAS